MSSWHHSARSMSGFAGCDKRDLLVGWRCEYGAAGGMNEKFVRSRKSGESWCGVDAVNAVGVVQRGLYVQ